MNDTIFSANDNKPSNYRTNRILLKVVTMLFAIVFIRLEYHEVALYGTRANWAIFAFYYLLELIYVVMSVTIILPLLARPRIKLAFKSLIVLSWILMAAAVSVLARIAIYYFADKTISLQQIISAYQSSLYRHCYISIYALVFFIARLFLLGKREREIAKKKLVEAEHHNARLESQLLGVQMDAHLMVNVLNTVQGDIMETAPQSSKLLYELSEIQEHIMLRSDPSTVSTLGNEVELMFHVIELYAGQGKTIGHFEFGIYKELMDVPFPSNLIVPIIENLFKHGDFEDEENSSLVQISGWPERLAINIRNKPNKVQFKKRRKLGLVNLRKRLEYHFPCQYELQEGIKDGMYELYLKIKFTDND